MNKTLLRRFSVNHPSSIGVCLLKVLDRISHRHSTPAQPWLCTQSVPWLSLCEVWPSREKDHLCLQHTLRGLCLWRILTTITACLFKTQVVTRVTTFRKPLKVFDLFTVRCEVDTIFGDSIYGPTEKCTRGSSVVEINPNPTHQETHVKPRKWKRGLQNELFLP